MLILVNCNPEYGNFCAASLAEGTLPKVHRG